MSGAFEIKVGTIAKLIACDNCGLEEDECFTDPCSHRRNNHKLVEILEEYPHEDSAMETPCYTVRVLSTGELLDEVRLWDFARPSALEALALQATE